MDVKAAENQPVPKPRRKRRILRFALWFTGGLVVLWIAAFLHATWSLNRAIAALKARGEPTTFEEALARNHANAKPSKAAEYLSRAVIENERAGRPGDVTAGKSATYMLPIDVKELDADRAYLKSGELVLQAVERALKEEPYPLTPMGTQLTSDVLSFPLSQDLRSVARLLVVDVRCSNLRLTSPLDRLGSMYRLTELFSKEQFLIPQLIRMALIGVANGAARDVLGPYFDSEELSDFDAMLAGIDSRLIIYDAFVNERAVNSTLLQTPEALRGMLHGEMARPSFPPPTATRKAFLGVDYVWTELLCTPIGLPLRLRAAADGLTVPDRVMKLVDTPLPWSSQDLNEYDHWNSSLYPGNVLLFHPKNLALHNVAVAARRTHRQLALLRLATRILRHQKVHSKLPESLADVCGDAPELPTKWFANESVLYTKEKNSFRLEAPPAVVPEVTLLKGMTRESFGLLLDVRWLPQNALP